jgi:DNA (cytosine-5)-methyltransferase 1
VDELRAGATARIGTAFRRVRSGGQRTEVRFDGLAGCLRTPRGGSGKQIVIVIDAGRLRMRWMSPREYARMQGVPDFPLVGGRNQQLFGFGDAVCVPAVEWVDRQVLTPLYESAQASRGNGHAGQPKS